MLARSSPLIFFLLLLAAAGSIGTAASSSSSGYGGLELGRASYGLPLDGPGKLKAAAAAVAAGHGGGDFQQELRYGAPGPPVIKRRYQHGHGAGSGGSGPGMRRQPEQVACPPVRLPSPKEPVEVFVLVCLGVGLVMFMVSWLAAEQQSRPPIPHRRSARWSSTSSRSIVLSRGRNGGVQALQIVDGGGGGKKEVLAMESRQRGWLESILASAVFSSSSSSTSSSSPPSRLEKQEVVGDCVRETFSGSKVLAEEEVPSPPVAASKQAAPQVRRRSTQKQQQGKQVRSSEGAGRQAHGGGGGGSVKQPKQSWSRRGGQASRRGFLGRVAAEDEVGSDSDSAPPGPAAAGYGRCEDKDEGGGAGKKSHEQQQQQQQDGIRNDWNEAGSEFEAAAFSPAPATASPFKSVGAAVQIPVRSARFQVGMWSTGGIWGPPGGIPPLGPLLPPSADFLAAAGRGSWPWESPTSSSFSPLAHFLKPGGAAESLAATEQQQAQQVSEAGSPPDYWKTVAEDIQNLLACAAVEDEQEFWQSVDTSRSNSSSSSPSVSSGTDTDGGSLPCSPSGLWTSPFIDGPGLSIEGAIASSSRVVGVIGEALASDSSSCPPSSCCLLQREEAFAASVPAVSTTSCSLFAADLFAAQI